MQLSSYPSLRPRRLRRTDWVRRLVRETRLTPDDLILAVIVHESDEGASTALIPSMPGISRLSLPQLAETARDAKSLGIPAIAIFPFLNPVKKDPSGSAAVDPDGLVCRAIKTIKDAVPDIGVICDVALDPFTDHGHDGIMENGFIANDPTIDCLIAQSLIQAEAGCDILAPSDMMDGRIGRIRQVLEAANFSDIALMAYAAKYASGFYAPYREAIGSTSLLKGHKKTYQMDPANRLEALREISLDVAEGADMILIKPGMPYLDILAKAAETCPLPVFAFQVSGEYAMITAAAHQGWIDRDQTILESLVGFKRAGASGVITYFALEAARLLGI